MPLRLPQAQCTVGDLRRRCCATLGIPEAAAGAYQLLNFRGLDLARMASERASALCVAFCRPSCMPPLSRFAALMRLRPPHACCARQMPLKKLAPAVHNNPLHITGALRKPRSAALCSCLVQLDPEELGQSLPEAGLRDEQAVLLIPKAGWARPARAACVHHAGCTFQLQQSTVLPVCPAHSRPGSIVLQQLLCAAAAALCSRKLESVRAAAGVGSQPGVATVPPARAPGSLVPQELCEAQMPHILRIAIKKSAVPGIALDPATLAWGSPEQIWAARRRQAQRAERGGEAAAAEQGLGGAEGEAHLQGEAVPEPEEYWEPLHFMPFNLHSAQEFPSVSGAVPVGAVHHGGLTQALCGLQRLVAGVSPVGWCTCALWPWHPVWMRHVPTRAAGD